MKKCLLGKVSLLVLCARGTGYDDPVAIVRLADVASLAGSKQARDT